MSAGAYHSSESLEWYTPKWLVEKVRDVLGNIDLDPCSCIEAQKSVLADVLYDKERDGLSQDWPGKVFMNPPGGWAEPSMADKWGSRSSAQCWYNKLLDQYKNGITTHAIVLCFNLDTLRALQSKNSICILAKRVKFNRIVNGEIVPGNSPAHGTGLILLSNSGEFKKRCIKVMSDVGTCYEAA